MTNLNTTAPVGNVDPAIAQKLLNKVNEKAAKVEMTQGIKTRDYASMRRFLKAYGRKTVETALRGAAAEVGDRRQPFALTAVITVVATENPKKKGTRAARVWKKYTTGMTVADAFKAGLERHDLNWDSDKGFIAIG